jgi:hypothetical protein
MPTHPSNVSPAGPDSTAALGSGLFGFRAELLKTAVASIVVPAGASIGSAN